MQDMSTFNKQTGQSLHAWQSSVIINSVWLNYYTTGTVTTGWNNDMITMHNKIKVAAQMQLLSSYIFVDYTDRINTIK